VNKIRVSAVSYTNTKPFVYGLQHSSIIERIELSLDNPSDCAQKLIDGQADIGLVPVAALPYIPNYRIISQYCIGADGAVNSVFIFSNKPIHLIQTIRYDKQSRTSNALAKILLANYWKIDPKVVSDDNCDAFVEIGDRTFGKKNLYPFVYDLAEEWKNFTGLPFAFAVWASNKEISRDFIEDFNDALAYGLKNLPAIINDLEKRNDFDLHDYLAHKLDFNLTDSKLDAVQQFLNYIQTDVVVS